MLQGRQGHHLWDRFRIYWDARIRWEWAGKPRLRTFAPYAHYCARVNLLYLVGYEVWPKGRELNDIADIEYLKLLPFIDAFASDDKLTRAMARHLLRPSQRLLSSSELRAEIPQDVQPTGT